MDNLYLIKINDLYGFINRHGDIVIEPKYKDARNFSDNLALVVFDDDDDGFIDKKGAIILKGKFPNLHEFKQGLSSFRKNGKVGFIDTKGDTVIEHKFDWLIHHFNEYGTAVVSMGEGAEEKWGMINRQGEFVIQPIYKSMPNVSEGLVVVSNNDKMGFMDEKGNLVIDYIFDSALPFSEGLASVSINGKAGYIDKTGKMIFEVDVDQAFNFTEGFALSSDS